MSHEDLYISTQSCPILIGINYTVSRTFSSLLLLWSHFFCILSQPKDSSKSETPRIARFWSILFKNAVGSITVFLLRCFVAIKNPQIWVPNFVGSKADIHGHPLQKFDLPKDCVTKPSPGYDRSMRSGVFCSTLCSISSKYDRNPGFRNSQTQPSRSEPDHKNNNCEILYRGVYRSNVDQTSII